MADIVTTLEARIRQEASKSKRKRIIRDLYEQLVPGRRSGQQKPGFYRDYALGGSGDLLSLISYVDERLREYKMETRAQRLRDQYSAFYPKKEEPE